MTVPQTTQARIGITLGEPAGIGPEVIGKALRSGLLPKRFEYQVIGRVGRTRPGRLTADSGRLAWDALEEAVQRYQTGEIQAIVTGPIQKENLARLGFAFAGQTEFFAARCGCPAEQAVMMLTDRRLTVSLLSTHLSLRDAIRRITAAKLRQVVQATDQYWVRLHGKRPRLAVAGVNPHAGEKGLFGQEEQRILAPAIAELQSQGFLIAGPHSPDTVFHRAAQGEFDVVICAYHDQGLIPFKLLAFSSGVNVTLGLPIVRTSPDHGTALDLAGRGQADPRSMIAAIRLAGRIVQRSIGSREQPSSRILDRAKK